jgi:hypothetical protein
MHVGMFRRLSLLFACLAWAVAASAQAQARLTIPAAASLVGAAPFFSDVRVFNTSFTAPVEVTATYRCFVGSCPAAAAQETFTLAPRESRAFDDMVVSAFDAPNSGGGVEFDIGSGASETDIVVTSRLYSDFPTPTVGMFIPGVAASAAHRYAVLTQVSNAGAGDGFRTNVGVFNGSDTTATVRFAGYDLGAFLGAVERTVPPHSGAQISNFFGSNGVNRPTLATSNAVVTVQTNGPAVFSYASVIDNHTTDPIFVSGAPDVAPVLSVGGNYPTEVALVPGQNTCGAVTVQDNPTTIVQAPGSHTLSLTHAGTTSTGTVADDGQFETVPQPLSVGGQQFLITITGQFTPGGFTAVARVDRTAPGTPCFYLVDWIGTKTGGANSFP